MMMPTPQRAIRSLPHNGSLPVATNSQPSTYRRDLYAHTHVLNLTHTQAHYTRIEPHADTHKHIKTNTNKKTNNYVH